MAAITTETGLVSWIKSQLGYPTINIEVSDQQIQEIIDLAILRFTEYSYGDLRETVIIQLHGAGEYPIPPSITNIIKLSTGSTSNITNFATNFGAGYVPNIWSEQFFTGSLTGDIIPSIIAISTTTSVLDKFFGNDIVYNFNPYKKTLNVLQDRHGPAILYYQYLYSANTSDDYIYDHEWIKMYSRAKVKELWSTITGKYDQSLIGGARINYDKLAQEAQTEIDWCNDQLLTKWSDPAPIDIA